MGIRYVGETVSKTLAKHFRSMDSLMSTNIEELVAVDEVGEKIAESVEQYFRNTDNLMLVTSLKHHGLKMEMDELPESSVKLNGLSFVISGTFLEHSREEIKAMIEQNGGKNLSAVSSNANYLVAGDKIGPAKLKKAQNLNIPIISENEFLKMIN